MPQSRLDPKLFELWIADQHPQNHNIIREIRSAIIEAGHNFQEGIKWGSPSYWLPEISRRNIVYIATHDKYVRLGFFNGATMPDPEKILQGTGKKLRHIKVQKLTHPTDTKTITKYIQLATQHAIQNPQSLSA